MKTAVVVNDNLEDSETSFETGSFYRKNESGELYFFTETLVGGSPPQFNLYSIHTGESYFGFNKPAIECCDRARDRFTKIPKVNISF